MKVLLLGNQARSVSNFWLVLMRHWLQKKHEVVCGIPEGDAPSCEKIRSLGVRLVHFRLDRKGLNPCNDLQSLGDLRKCMREERPDFVFATTIKLVIYGVIAAKLEHVPHIYATITGLGYAFEKDTLLKRLINIVVVALYRFALKNIQGVFFQNTDDYRIFQENGILDKKTPHFFARGTGVDTRHFAEMPLPSNDSVTFLLVARLLEAKGIYDYAQAARMVKKRYPQAHFQLLGPEEKNRGGIPLSEVLAWQKEGILEYLGATLDVRPFLARAHLLVLPSWREGIPTSIMEGMSVGRGAIVTDVAGCREVVQDGENGFLVPCRDARALSLAFEKCLDHPELIEKFAKTSRKMAEDVFDADGVADGILSDMGL